MNDKKYPPMLVIIRLRTEPIKFNEISDTGIIYIFEKTLRITEYDPDKDYNKALKEALDTLKADVRQYIKDCESKIHIIIKVELDDTVGEFIRNCGYTMGIDEALVSLNKYVEDYFIEPDLFEFDI